MPMLRKPDARTRRGGPPRVESGGTSSVPNRNPTRRNGFLMPENLFIVGFLKVLGGWPLPKSGLGTRRSSGPRLSLIPAHPRGLPHCAVVDASALCGFPPAGGTLSPGSSLAVRCALSAGLPVWCAGPWPCVPSPWSPLRLAGVPGFACLPASLCSRAVQGRFRAKSLAKPIV